MANNSKEEPKTAPQADRWYSLSLGSSFKEDSSNKYCTLRYEFKPASIDKTKPGSMKKTKENRVSVEFQNNQAGKPKVTFEGSSEDYKESDAVLFFDGQTFRLERLHRAVKQLRHLRMPGESSLIEPRLSPPPPKAPKITHVARSAFPTLPVEVERIDIGGSENPGGSRSASKGVAADHPPSDQPLVISPDPKNENEEAEEHQDIDIEDIFGAQSPGEEAVNGGGGGSDDEIADVDDSGDEVDKGPNAAEALRAQVNAEQRSSSSSSSGSATATTGSASGSSSSSDSEASDEDSVNSI